MTADSLPAIAAGLAALTVILLVLLLLANPAGAQIAALEARLRLDADTQRRAMTELDQGLRRELASATQTALRAAFEQVLAGNEAMQATLNAFRTRVGDTLEQSGATTGAALAEFARHLCDEQEKLRARVAEQLELLRAGNEAKLEAMRQAVDEKLQAAVESRVTASFQRVTEQLAQLHQDIGHVQSVAGQVGDLKRLFSNVKTRGGWGEAQVEAMLQDALPAGSYARNLRLREGSAEQVEFALRVPVRGGDEIWVPIDAKFPTEDYDRLLLAAEAGEREDETAARRGLERRIRLEAARIAGKYIVPPRTVEFAVLYLPTDGLFAEVARTPGLVEAVRREHRVMVMGPSLLPAFLHTIRVGHLTIALEQRASEIGKTLSAVKSEWAKLGGALDTLASRAELLSKGIEETRTRTRVVGRKLRGVDEIAYDVAERVLGLEQSPTVAPETVDPP